MKQARCRRCWFQDAVCFQVSLDVWAVLISRLGSVWMSAKMQKTVEEFITSNTLHYTCYKLHVVCKHIRLLVCLSWPRMFFMFILLCINSSLPHLWLFIGLLVLPCCLYDILWGGVFEPACLWHRYFHVKCRSCNIDFATHHFNAHAAITMMGYRPVQVMGFTVNLICLYALHDNGGSIQSTIPRCTATHDL